MKDKKLRKKLRLLLSEPAPATSNPDLQPIVANAILDKVIECVREYKDEYSIPQMIQQSLLNTHKPIKLYFSSTDKMYYFSWGNGASAWYRFDDPRSHEEIADEVAKVIKISLGVES